MITVSAGTFGWNLINVAGQLASPIADADLNLNFTYIDWLQAFNGDVAATLGYLRDVGLTPVGMPVPTVSAPLSTTTSVVQSPAFAPSVSIYTYQSATINFYTNGANIYFSAINEITTGIQPSLILSKVTSPISKVASRGVGNSGIISMQMIGYQAGYNYAITAGGLIVGRSKFTYYTSISATLASPTVTNTNGVISITNPLSSSGKTIYGIRNEWRKKNSDWSWQPYVGPFQKPSGSYTLEVRAMKLGLNDTNATAELVIA